MILAKPIDCLSLCGILPRLTGKSGEIGREISRLLALFSKADGAGLPERVYIGSSFCPQLVMELGVQYVAALAERVSSAGSSITLVLPIASQSRIDALNAAACELIAASDGVIDELTVNDYGAFMHWGERIADEGLPIGLNLGRLFYKDARDPRDSVYCSIPHEPLLLQLGQYGYGNIERLRQTYPIRGVEFDPTHTVLDLNALPQDVNAAVYGPQCYMSCAQICEFASIGVEVQGKFRPNMPCALQCQRTTITYTGHSGERFSKIGRAVYFDAVQPQVRGVERYRKIFAPLKEVLG